MALGAGETTLLRMANAYGMLVNGGKRVTPTLIDRVQDRSGKTIYRHDERALRDLPRRGLERPDRAGACSTRASRSTIRNRSTRSSTSCRASTVRGTAAALASLNKPLAGKTGTSNDAKDLWFIGFSPDLVIGVYVGFDEPRTLGRGETGGSVAVPIFKDYRARSSLKDRPNTPFRVPPDMKMVRINADDRRAGRRRRRSHPRGLQARHRTGSGDAHGAATARGNFSVLGVDPAAASGCVVARPFPGTGETY